jgi:hypothetical protein
MDPSRRDVLAASALLAGFSATAAGARMTKAPEGLMEVLHVHAGADGISRARRVRVYGARPIPVVEVIAGSIGTGLTPWGTAPRKRFSINTTGDLEVELADGTRHRIGKGDLVFIDDQHGKGHRSHMLTPIANLFLIVPDDFDLLAWAGEPPAAP